MNKRVTFGLFLFFVALWTGTLPALAQDEEAAGRSAEQAGLQREGLTHYLAALQNAKAGSEADQRLRKKIIVLAQSLAPPLGTPEEARRHFVRADTLARDAHAPGDFPPVIDEYRQALALAPWWAIAYHDLAIVEEAAGLFDDARKDLHFFLLTKPAEGEARAAQDEIYKIEAKQQETAKRAADEAVKAQQRAADEAVKAQQQAAADAERRANMFVGRWYYQGNSPTYIIEITRTSNRFYASVAPYSTIEAIPVQGHPEQPSGTRTRAIQVTDFRVDGRNITFTRHDANYTTFPGRSGGLAVSWEDRYDLTISDDGKTLSGTLARQYCQGWVQCGGWQGQNTSQVELYRRD